MSSRSSHAGPVILIALVALGFVGFNAWWLMLRPPPAEAGVGDLSRQIRLASVHGDKIVRDDAGREVYIPTRPERIVSLAPSFTETLYLLGVQDRLVGVTSYCLYPPEAQQKTVVGTLVAPSLETLASLQPDITLAMTHTPRAVVEQLTDAKVAVVAFDDSRGLADVLARMDFIATILSVDDTGLARLQAWRAQFDHIVAAIAAQPGRKTPTAIAFIGPPTNGYAAGKGSFLADMIDAAGGRNVMPQTGWPKLTPEGLTSLDPDVILMIGAGKAPVAKTADQAAALEASAGAPLRITETPAGVDESWWRQLKAVKAGRVYGLEPDWVEIPGPRLLNGLRQIALALHPELAETLKAR